MEIVKEMTEEISITEVVSDESGIGMLVKAILSLIVGTLIALIPTLIILLIWNNAAFCFMAFLLFFYVAMKLESKAKTVTRKSIEANKVLVLQLTLFQELILKSLEVKDYKIAELGRKFERFSDVEFIESSLDELIANRLIDFDNSLESFKITRKGISILK